MMNNSHMRTNSSSKETSGAATVTTRGNFGYKKNHNGSIIIN